MSPRLKEIYLKEIQTALKDQFGLKNIYMGPKIEKVVLNMGLGLDGNDSKILKSCEEDMGDRTAKYNQLLRIEEMLGSSAKYAGKTILKH